MGIGFQQLKRHFQAQRHVIAPPTPTDAQARRWLGDYAWAAHVITTSMDSAQSVFAIDMDGDGDVDVLSASSLRDPQQSVDTSLGVLRPHTHTRSKRRTDRHGEIHTDRDKCADGDSDTAQIDGFRQR